MSIFFVLCCLSNCTDTAILDQTASFKDQQWHYNEQPRFQVKISDNSIPYDIYLTLRHSSDYKFSNLFLLVKESNQMKLKTYRIETKLAEPDGRWLGNGSGGIYTHQVRISKNYLYPDTGVYNYQLEQNMRVNPLRGVENVGIRIVPSSP